MSYCHLANNSRHSGGSRSLHLQHPGVQETVWYAKKTLNSSTTVVRTSNLASLILIPNFYTNIFPMIYSQCHLTPWNCTMMALWLKGLPHETAADKGCFRTITANNDLSRKAHTERTKTEHKRILYTRQQKQTNATLNFFQVLVYPYI